jgi:RNA polymerase sigma-70 factor (ECF subfamily)
MQDIHFALWRSFATFDDRCALRTWVYRVAHNVATSHALRDKRRRTRALVGLEVLEREGAEGAQGAEAPDAQLAERLDVAERRTHLLSLIERLAPVDRQLMLLYLEGLDAATIGTVTGLSRENVSTKVHRIKRILAAAVHAKSGSAGGVR